MEDRTIRALRAHIADYENKVADVGLELFRQKKSLESKENELKYVNEETKRLRSCTDDVLKKIEEASQALWKQQNAIATLQTDSVSLAQALDLLKNEIIKRTATLKETKIANRKCLEDLVMKSQEHQAYYDSLEIVKKIRELDRMDTSQADAKQQCISMDTDKRTNQKSAALERELDGLRSSCQTIQSQIEETETSLKQLFSKYSKSQEEHQDVELDELAAKVRDFEDEREKEEEYIKSLQTSLSQLVALKQLVECSSCGHSYLVSLDNAQETPAAM